MFPTLTSQGLKDGEASLEEMVTSHKDENRFTHKDERMKGIDNSNRHGTSSFSATKDQDKRLIQGQMKPSEAAQFPAAEVVEHWAN